MLFYVGCLVAYTADVVSQLLVSLAWVFVTGALVLMGFWVILGRALLARI